MKEAAATAIAEVVEPALLVEEFAVDVLQPLDEPVTVVEETFEPEHDSEIELEPQVVEPLPAFVEEERISRPPVTTIAWRAVKAVGRGLGELVIVVVDHVEPVREAAVRWLMRGAAIASVMSIVLVIGVNRGRLFDRWDRLSAMVVAAANRPLAPPPPVVPPPAAGMGRVTINSSDGAIVLVDGAIHGPAPVTLDLPAGPHRVLLRSGDGSVERTIRIQNAEISEMNESIFPGWVALTTTTDLSLSEGGRTLKRDERGWVMLPPGLHEIHLDNNALGVHEVRRIVVTPGDTTRISFAAHTSTISLTANELADVWIDGTPYGQAPLVDQPIAIGVHDVRVRSAAHERWLRVRATVQPLTVNVDLTAN